MSESVGTTLSTASEGILGAMTAKNATEWQVWLPCYF